MRSGARNTQTCEHVDMIEDVTPDAEGCSECIAIGDTWVHLHLCMTCGHVGCCESSKNKHARKHAHAANHPIIRSFEPDQDWMYCYLDKAYVTLPD